MRRVLLALLVGLCVAGPALSQVPPCSTGTSIPVSYRVPDPCPGQPLSLIVASCRPCVDLNGWVAPPGGPITVFADMDLPNCILAVCQPDTEVVPLRAFAPGTHTLIVTLQGSVRRPDGTVCSVIQQDSVTFSVPLSCEPPPPPPPPCSTHVQVPVAFHVPEPCPNRPLALVAQACGPCVDLTGWTRRPGEPIQVLATMDPSRCMLDVCVPDAVEIPLGTFAPGNYTVSVRVMGTIVQRDSAACSSSNIRLVDFTVPFNCDTAPPPPCSTNVRLPISLEVPNPCPDRPLTLVARACGPCVDLRGFGLPPHGPIALGAVMDESRCLNRICNPERVELRLGAYAPGRHEIVVEVHGTILRTDGSACPSVRREVISFDVPFQCDSTIPPCPSGTTIPIRFAVPNPCPDRPNRLVATACGPCVDLIGWSRAASGTLQLRAAMDTRRCLPAVCQPETLGFDLGVLPPGHHTRLLEVRGLVTGADGRSCAVVQRHEVSFGVPRACAPPPPPLPYVELVRVGTPAPCAACPPPAICPHRPIPFLVAGRFVDDCVDFRGLQLLPNPMAGPLPQPPIARITMGVNDCLGRPCRMIESRWQASAALPSLPPGDYRMTVEEAWVSWCDSARVDTVFTSFVTFSVAPSCSLPPPADCYLPGWRRPSGDPCNAFVGSGTPGRVVFEMQSGAPIAGIQGRLVLDPAALHIAGLRPIGPAAGMRLFWQRSPQGATFVLYSEDGSTLDPPPCDTRGLPCPTPLLEVLVAAAPGAPIPNVTMLRPEDLLVSDARGHEVPPCPTFALIAPAILCAGRSCDFNADGRIDVRDLVLMVRCVRDSTCPDSATARFDCNQDGRLTIDDVLCCARVILHGAAPDGVASRPAPELQVRLGAPSVTAAGIDLPVRISRADLVGAGRLVFDYPPGFDQVEVELRGDAGSWLEVSEAAEGEMILGLVATAPAFESASDLEMVLRFRGSAGPGARSGPITLVDQEFAGRDGALLLPGTPQTAAPGTRIELALSEARPNPFTRETRFVLGLSQAAAGAEVAVFDLSGRRVTTLHQGSLAAGEHPFRWDGTRGDGVRVTDGVYFYRAQVGGHAATRKLVLLRGR